jgi:hypothetical protein
MTVQRKLNYIYLAFFVAQFFALMGCHVGGNITAMPEQAPPPTPFIKNPVISSPAPEGSVYYSKEFVLHLKGVCNSGSTIELSGDASDFQTCKQSSFEFEVIKNAEGLYSLTIIQIDSDGNTSNPSPFIWIIKNSVAPVVITKINSFNYTSRFATSLTNILLEGQCESGTGLQITGLPLGTIYSGSTTCQSGVFNMSAQIPTLTYQQYSVILTQTDVAKNSNQVAFTWDRFPLSTNQSNTNLSIPIMSQLAFQIAGGSKNYLFTLNSLSGGIGVYNGTTGVYTYTAGREATGVNGNADILTITDAMDGTILTYNISLTPGSPDHLNFVGSRASSTSSESAQTGIIGQQIGADGSGTYEVEVKVVDQYDNGIAGVPLLISNVFGGATTPSNGILFSDALGVVKTKIQLDYCSYSNRFIVQALSGVLPDVSQSGRHILMFNELGRASSTSSVFGSTYSIPTVGGNYPNPDKGIFVDLNNDSIDDFVFVDVSAMAANVVAYLGTNKGMFGSIKTITIAPLSCVYPSGVTSGDFYNDTKNHLAVVCASTNTLVILKNDGSGNLTADKVVTGVGAAPMALVAGRFRGANQPLDLAIASMIDDSIYIYRGSNDGNFVLNAQVQLPTGANPASLVLANLQLPNNLTTATSNDLIVGNRGLTVGSISSMISLLIDKRDGSGGFYYTQGINDYPSDGEVVVGLAVGDLTGDNYNDIVAVNQDTSTISFFYNSGVGNAVVSIGDNMPASDSGNLATPVSVSLGDYNIDGLIDVSVVNQAENNIFVLYNGGNNSSAGGVDYAMSPAVGVNLTPNFIKSKDVNSDGMQDLLVLTQDNGAGTGLPGLQILFGDGGGYFNNVPLELGSQYFATSGDYDGDGILDFASFNPTNTALTVLKGLKTSYGNGSGVFVAMSAAPSPVPTAYPKTTSIFSQTNAMVSVIARPQITPLRLDLLVADRTHNTIVVFLGRGDGTFQSTSAFPSQGNLPVGLVAADFDRDAVNDLAVVNKGSSSVAIFKGNGAGGFQYLTSYNVGPSPAGIVASDFTADGRISLATTNNDGTFSVLLGNNNCTFQVQSPVSVYPILIDNSAAGPTSLVAGAFNEANPYQVDLAILNFDEKRISILHGTTNQTGVFNSSNQDIYDISMTMTPTQLIYGDFNGDNMVDLGVIDPGASLFIYLKGIGQGKFNAAVVTVPIYPVQDNPDWWAPGDFNGDGRLDFTIVNNKTILSTIQVFLGH